jgi:hypothetical protein
LNVIRIVVASLANRPCEKAAQRGKSHEQGPAVRVQRGRVFGRRTLDGQSRNLVETSLLEILVDVVLEKCATNDESHSFSHIIEEAQAPLSLIPC